MTTNAKYYVKQESKHRDGKLWDWSMWIEATDRADIEYVQSVTYGLHPAFPNPNRVIRAPSVTFRLDMSSALPQDKTWGRFDVRVTLVLTNGKREMHTVPLMLLLPTQTPADPLLPLPPDADYDVSMRYYRLLKQKSAFGYAREVLEHAAKILPNDARKNDPEWVRRQRLLIGQQRSLCTYKDPSLPNDERLKHALKILVDDCGLDLQTCDDPETLGLGGAIYKRIWDVDRARANLELALAYYRRGYQQMLAQPNRHDYDAGAFTGANVIYVCDVLALATPAEVDPTVRSVRLSEADQVRRQLVKDLPVLLQKGPNWWLAGTLLGVYFDLGCQDASYRAKACEQAATLRKIDVDPWEQQSTGSQLLRSARLQKALGRGAAADIDGLRKDVLQAAFGDFNFDHDWFEGKLGLALSGGGFRASLFHVGVLARLAELDLLRHIEVISCVSGGSIVGVHYYLLLRKLLQETGDKAISHDDYLDLVEDLLDQFLAGVQKNIRMRVGASWFANLRMIFQPSSYSRTQQLGRLYEKYLYAQVGDGEGDSPRWLNEAFIVPKSDTEGYENAFSPKLDNWRRGAKVPMLVLNATTLNTGRNWQFTASFMGEPLSYGTAVDATERLDTVYYIEAPERWRRYRLGDAVAASSCVPALFTPIVIPGLFEDRTVRLVDGGVHDNQGTRALLDQDCDAVIVSDASGQMESLPNPAHGELGVILRTNSVLQARVRVAQHQELKARERASLLRHCAFLHLRKDIEAPVQKAVVHETGVASPPASSRTRTGDGTAGACTEYGTARTVQGALSRLRTDLDSFTEREAFSLMFSGYKMAAKYSAALPSHPDGNDHAKTRAWRFMRVAGAVAGSDQPDLGAESLLRHLTVGSRLGFKVWRLHPVLNALRVLFLTVVVFAAIGGLYYLASEDVHYPLPLGDVAKWLLAAAAAAVAGMLVPIAKAWIKRARVAMNPMSTLGRIAAGIGMATVGFLLCRLHLWTFDRLFLRLGRVDASRETRSGGIRLRQERAADLETQRPLASDEEAADRIDEPHDRLPVTPNRVALIAISAFASAAGLLPYLLLIDRVRFLWAVVPAAAAGAALSLIRLTTAAPTRPSFAAWVLGAWSTLWYPAGASLIGLMWYGITYGATKGVTAVAARVGFDLALNSSAWGYWVSVVLVVPMFLVGSSQGIRTVAQQLYPREAWTRSAFSGLPARSTALLLGGGLAVALLVAALFWFLRPDSVGLPISLALLMCYTSLPLTRLGETAPRNALESSVIKTLTSALESAGYRIVARPRTGKREIDPLLRSVDLLAKRGDRAFAVEVKSLDSDTAAEWSTATALQTAATLLSDEVAPHGGNAIAVQPVLMLVGGKVAQSLEKFSQREQVPFVHFDSVAQATAEVPAWVQQLTAPDPLRAVDVSSSVRA